MIYKLDEYLKNYENDENSSVSNNWYNFAFEDAIKIIDKFQEEDWIELEKMISNRSVKWKRRLAYCLNKANDDKQLKILLIMSNTDDNYLFREIISNLFKSNIEKIYNIDEILKNISKLLPASNSIELIIYSNFIKHVKEYNKTKMLNGGDKAIYNNNLKNNSAIKGYK